MRRLLTRLHRWIGIVLFAYVAMICLTGSVLVYRPELYRHFEPQPLIVEMGAQPLSDDDLRRHAARAFPDERPAEIWRGQRPDHAVEIALDSGHETRGHLFDPYTGAALRPALPLGFRLTSFALELHRELIGGDSGRVVNGAFALGFIFLVLTGMLTWRPRKQARQAAPPRAKRGRITGWLRRQHRTVGIWSSLFVLMWAITGLHLAWPEVMTALVDHFEPFDEANPVERTGDTISYWLAYAHFGRFGRRIPGCEAAICGEGFKALWALLALAPAFLAMSGIWLWLRGRITRFRRKRVEPTGDQP